VLQDRDGDMPPSMQDCSLVMFPSPVRGALSEGIFSLQSSAVEQVLDILTDILSCEIAEVVSPCLPRGL